MIIPDGQGEKEEEEEGEENQSKGGGAWKSCARKNLGQMCFTRIDHTEGSEH
jgi:hypothetical protein